MYKFIFTHKKPCCDGNRHAGNAPAIFGLSTRSFK